MDRTVKFMDNETTAKTANKRERPARGFRRFRSFAVSLRLPGLPKWLDAVGVVALDWGSVPDSRCCSRLRLNRIAFSEIHLSGTLYAEFHDCTRSCRLSLIA